MAEGIVRPTGPVGRTSTPAPGIVACVLTRGFDRDRIREALRLASEAEQVEAVLAADRARVRLLAVLEAS